MANLKSKKVGELRGLAEEAGVEGFEEMTKNQLAEALGEVAVDDDAGDSDSDDGDDSDKADDGDEDSDDSDDEDSDDGDDSGDEDEDEELPLVQVENALQEADREDFPLTEKARKTREAYMKMPKVSLYIPLEGGEKRGSTKSITVNGWRLNILKGVNVEVPKGIADLFYQSQEQEAEAHANAEEFEIDGHEGALS